VNLNGQDDTKTKTSAHSTLLDVKPAGTYSAYCGAVPLRVCLGSDDVM
jgi:hypothetical protein